jgi:hypothetical protein
MKHPRPIVLILILILAACAFLLYRASRSPEEISQGDITKCDQGLWNYVYQPDRLQVLNPCISITGTVESVRTEADGDYHIRFHLDPEFVSLLNEKNISDQHGDLVLESICQDRVSQADAVDSCNRYDGPRIRPERGQRYRVWGSYVHDAQHGWNELHPITSMEPIQ